MFFYVYIFQDALDTWFIKTFIDYLLCVRHYVRCCKFSGEKLGAYVSVGNKLVNK